jgi:6-pyruvoyltetrahydropterin/6-carboxytetrahydropterin synthase
MYLTAITTSFSAAHYLREYEGTCEKLHGHNWKIEVAVETGELDRAGMGLDFRVLKEKTAEVIAALDHSVLNELPPFLEQNPSSENLARHIFSELVEAVDDGRVRLRGVKVWESDTSWAEYRP